jgi:hypothetical protein
MFQKTSLTLLMAGVASIALPVYGQSGEAGQASRQTAVVYRFAVQSESVTDAVALSLQACLEETSGAPEDADATKNLTVDPKILNEISAELQKRLSKKMSVMVDPDPGSIPVGSLVVTGCISKAQKGSVAGRMVGLGLGASRLYAHVVVLSRSETGFTPVDSFDLQVKGRLILPPVGPAGVAIHAARQPQKTLSADAKKLAREVVKKLDTDMQQQEQVAKAS